MAVLCVCRGTECVLIDELIDEWGWRERARGGESEWRGETALLASANGLRLLWSKQSTEKDQHLHTCARIRTHAECLHTLYVHKNNYNINTHAFKLNLHSQEPQGIGAAMSAHDSTPC